jgi:hypothetical protein
VVVVAAFSKFHFHRQFTATFGLSVHRYVQLALLKRASHRPIEANGEQIKAGEIPGGRCASSATPTIWSPPRSIFNIWLKPENRCLVPANSFSEYAPEPRATITRPA